MPRFDFQCRECEKTFEHLLPAGAPLPPCLHCGSTDVQKLLSPPGVIFKGSGFYKTDSRKGEEQKKKPSAPAPSETTTAAPKTPEESKKPPSAHKTP